MPTCTDQVPVEAMTMTAQEVRLRKSQFAITARDETALREVQRLIDDELHLIVEEFYGLQARDADAERQKRHEASMRRYVSELFSGKIDRDYVASRMRIGELQLRTGMTPRLYLPAVKHLQDILNRTIDRVRPSSPQVERARCKEALRKMLLFDVELVFDTYVRSLVNDVEVSKADLRQHASQLDRRVAERTRKLEDLAYNDALTGLSNQRALFEEMGRVLALADRHRYPVSLIFVDLNGFKAVNDGRGHRAGDLVLSQMGAAVRETIRRSDIAYRYGGDEFCIALPRCTRRDARRHCTRLIANFDRRNMAGVSMSMGIAVTGPEVFVSADMLVQMADAAMYEAKSAARSKPGHQIRTYRQSRR